MPIFDVRLDGFLACGATRAAVPEAAMNQNNRSRSREAGQAHMHRDARERPSKTSFSRLACLYSLHTEHDPWRASAFAWRTGGDDNGLLCALEPVNLTVEFGDLLLSLG
jgi:hypothetical protein